MRPALLDPLFAHLDALDGVGPKTADLLAKLLPTTSGEAPRIADLLLLPPHSVIDRRARPQIMDASDGAIVTLEVRVDRHQPPPSGRNNVPYRVFCHDDSGEIALVFFRGRAQWLGKILPEGETVIVSGRFEWFNGRASMVHPDHIAVTGQEGDLPLVEPVYPLTEGLTLKMLRKAMQAALARLPELGEWIDPGVVRREGFAGFVVCLQALHNPGEPTQVSPDGREWKRLAYDEMLAGQLSLGLVRRKVTGLKGRPLVGDGRLRARLRAALTFALTGSQETAVEEIAQDLASPNRMIRLLQGDVGSGKTVVALLAAAQAIEAGGQAAIMAPTEVLARQHFATIEPICAKVGLRIAVLTGRDKGAAGEAIRSALADGSIDLVVGTHALFQDSVSFKNLLFVTIDEQHRFGVHQRMRLNAKGDAPDMLVMTATPIPRTLVLTAFGDMDVSRLTEKPAGRKPIHTVTLPMERLDGLIDRVGNAMARGEKAYWICPLVEESEVVGLTSAEDRFLALKKRFGAKVGIIHGRMKAAEKDAAMAAFASGVTRILVATTVIEVGIDVRDATIIVIEHAEHFGLSQLHQLRGRVGRGEAPSSCVLLYKAPLGATAEARLKILRESEDGFLIAEEDLRIRGEGELLGTRQSGMPGFRLARLESHGALLEIARQDARLTIETDPDLTTPRGEALRTLLYIFGRDEAIRLLRAG
jgi:ATP-dependent DNA helicase RecG